jgi:hypothetical protein
MHGWHFFEFFLNLEQVLAFTFFGLHSILSDKV